MPVVNNPENTGNMETFFLVIKYAAAGILLLVIVAAVILAISYNSMYKPPPPLPGEKTFSPSIDDQTVEQGKFPVIMPVPKELEVMTGSFRVPDAVNYVSETGNNGIGDEMIERFSGLPLTVTGSPWLRFIRDGRLPEQGYSLIIGAGGIDIEGGGNAGLFYGLVTLGQIIDQSEGNIPAMKITDWPDMETRGVMLDISRDKVPSMETLYGIVDFLASMKYNHLQLYVEGFSFAYESFRELWEDTETPVTGEEMKLLDRYCAERFIDLVPNQNSLGHMSAWLETERFSDLAECPGGYKLMGLIDMKSTLNVSDKRSMELVRQMTDDMLPWFSSGYFNANLDEPFELGKCKNRKLAEEKGVGRLYIDFVKELESFIRSKGKRMMMWGDIVTRHPEIIPQIPEDVVMIEWGYESVHPFEQNCRRYHEAGLDFMVAPGTSSWTSITGRTSNMMENISNAVGSGLKYDAMGMLLTDWGDMGHWQYWPVSYAPLAYGAALSWNYDSRDDLPLAEFLNRSVFADRAGIMGSLVLDMGRYNRFEEYEMLNMTTTMMTYMLGLTDKVMVDAIYAKMLEGVFDLTGYDEELTSAVMKRFDEPAPYDYRSIISYTEMLRNSLTEADMDRADAQLIKDEYTNAVNMIHLGARARQYMIYRRENSAAGNIVLLEQILDLADEVEREHRRLWLARNREGGLERSLSLIIQLRKHAERDLKIMRRSRLERSVIMTGEKIAAAAAAIYIRTR
ncbi:MAG: hypothetical protein EA408_10180 [Marinilabiliales bacterium]|nr:MAG: hypothetical protein EA408_10180 [Marinilabiliales bacterium]